MSTTSLSPGAGQPAGAYDALLERVEVAEQAVRTAWLEQVRSLLALAEAMPPRPVDAPVSQVDPVDHALEAAAWACGTGTLTMLRRLRAAQLIEEHPRLADAVTRGRSSGEHMMVVADALAAVDGEFHGPVLARVLPADPDHAAWSLTVAELRGRLARVIRAVDPAGARLRRQQEQRRAVGVRVRQLGDGLAALSATGNAVTVQAIARLVRALSDASGDPADDRSHAQREVDTLASAVLAAARRAGIPGVELELQLELPVTVTEHRPTSPLTPPEPAVIRSELTPAMVQALIDALHTLPQTLPSLFDPESDPPPPPTPAGEPGDRRQDLADYLAALPELDLTEPDADPGSSSDPCGLTDRPRSRLRPDDLPPASRGADAPLDADGSGTDTTRGTTTGATNDTANGRTNGTATGRTNDAATGRTNDTATGVTGTTTAPTPGTTRGAGPTALAAPHPAGRQLLPDDVRQRPRAVTGSPPPQHPVPGDGSDGFDDPLLPALPVRSLPLVGGHPVDPNVLFELLDPAGLPLAIHRVTVRRLLRDSATGQIVAVDATPMSLADLLTTLGRPRPRPTGSDTDTTGTERDSPGAAPTGTDRTSPRATGIDAEITASGGTPTGSGTGVQTDGPADPNDLDQRIHALAAHLSADLPTPPPATSSYRPTAAQRRLVLARDSHCTFPGCTRPAAQCELDHRQPYRTTLSTTVTSLDPRCTRHHRLKHDGWTVTRASDGSHTWTSPYRQTRKSPPRNALG